ncbi:hypothetical protein [Agromyces archimandritae]|uniref:Uncharacterized protein n=1 Tax=Agromyces archimandritae TaxID=2781962 RepID=A0A975FM40_9MICO|nr:hypothetical protein [Agromyces archimandritae]QTX04436.1 hypothetical protein G127AT_14380 [Agromyces archimandritae]
MTTYRPDPAGEWIALVRDSRALVLESARADDETIAALWQALAEDDPTTVVIERLTAGGLGSTPAFALVYRRGGANGVARAVVRGPIEVRLGEERVDGREVSTWSERTAIDAGVLEIAAGGEGADDAPVWPLLAGIVLSGHLSVEDDGTAGAAGRLAVPHAEAPATEPSRVDARPAAQAPAPPAAAPVAPPTAVAPPAPAVPSFAEHTIVPAADDPAHTIVPPAFGAAPAAAPAAAPEGGLGDS